MFIEETVGLMLSDDFKDRFKAEYHQLSKRIIGLRTTLERWKTGNLEFKPNSSYRLVYAQLKAMEAYKVILEERASHEGIVLNENVANAG